MKSLEVPLKKEEVEFLKEFVKNGEHKAKEIIRANILLSSYNGEKERTVAEFLSINKRTVWITKRKYLNEGLMSALKDKPRSGQPPKYVIKHETEIAALACTKPPAGRKRWSLVLLEKELRKQGGDFKTINHESIRLILKKTRQSRG